MIVIDVTTMQRQVRIRFVFSTISFAHLLAEYRGLHGPRGWELHKIEGESAPIHHLLESYPPTRNANIELLYWVREKETHKSVGARDCCCQHRRKYYPN